MYIRNAVELACILEATARKPGNVHRDRDFPELGYLDFLQSAVAIGPVLETSPGRGVGASVLDAIRATRRVVHTNTNLGIVLLLAPLCASDPDPKAARAAVDESDWRRAVERTLNRLTIADAQDAYKAIRLAVPGGMGEAPEEDVRSVPTSDLRSAMTLAKDRDAIAAQYANGFDDVFQLGLPALRNALSSRASLEEAIVVCHLHWMAQRPDTLIARKRGVAESLEAGRRAAILLAGAEPNRIVGGLSGRPLRELDEWLTAAGNGRNPGASADLTTASLYLLLRSGDPPPDLLHFPHQQNQS